MRPDGVAVDMQASSAMADLWRAVSRGDVGEVKRLVGQDAGLLNAKDEDSGETPLMHASYEGHVGVVRCLLDAGAAMDQRDAQGGTALWHASRGGHSPVVELLLARGADPAIAGYARMSPLSQASVGGHLEVVHFLLGHSSVKATIDSRDDYGQTALWCACCMGRGGVARALLENGADRFIGTEDGITPMDIAKRDLKENEVACGVTAEGRRDCVAALEVRSHLSLSPSLST
jgi:ankyrin repeat protein